MEKFIFLVFLANFGFCISHLFRNGVGDPSVSQNAEQSNSQPSPPEQYFSQKLDHFNENDKRVWNQRYWKTDQFYKTGGPVFMWINGIHPATSNWIVKAQYLEYAQKLGAMAFSLEHRFCGNSHPLPDTSTENLAYLHSEQVIGDIANFIRGMNKLINLPCKTKWFLFGGSYAGALAAWARLKYPDVVYGVVASSAIVFTKVDLKEYSEFVKNVLASYNPKCPQVIMEAHKEMDEYLKDETGRKKLTKIFQLCDEFKLGVNQDDTSNFFYDLAGFVMSVVQYSKDNKESPIKDTTVETICDILLKENSSPVTLYGELNALSQKLYNDGGCLDSRYQPAVDDLKLIDYESSNQTDRPQIYRDCTEFASFQTSSSPEELFGNHFSVDFFFKRCEAVFGSRFNRQSLETAVARLNQNYGGYDFNADNTIFVNSLNDPWSPMSIIKAKSGALYHVISIKGGAHCSDVYPSRDEDSPELKKAREEILSLLTSWIATP